MNGPFQDQEMLELRSLLDALCEDSISTEQMQRLEQLVLNHPQAEAYYVQYMSLHADLVGHFGALPAKMEESLRCRIGAEQPSRERTQPALAAADAPSLAPRRRLRRLVWAGGVAAGLAAAVLLAVSLIKPSRVGVTPPSAAAAEVTDNTVAVLLRAPAAVWEENEMPVRAGTPLAPGWLRLKSGYAHIEFYSGATVILEGPAEFRLVSRNEAYCARGKLRATVPSHAHGFTINSPKLGLVDRGTEFGLSVGETGKTEVHVFEGKVDLYDAAASPKGPPQKELLTGQGVRLDGPALVAIKLNADFRTAPELTARTAKELLDRQKDWLAASEALRRDPSLLLYYTFQNDEPWNRTLLDRARAGQQAHDGAIVGSSWVTGRWPGKPGLEFKRVSDRVRINVPGEFHSVTLMAWVRVDALPNLNNSLMMADGWGPGGMHWQIGDTGTIILGVQGPPKVRGAHYHAPGIFTPERFGQWVHLAVVYDHEAEEVTHYVDGRPVAQLSVLFEVPLRIGEAELGNWNVAAHRNSTPVRNLNGCMDEFMMFSRPLAPEEIEQHYNHGRPPG
jgi:hypothetical protein